MNKRIFIADDDEDILYTLRVMLEAAGYEVVCSVNGRYALDGDYEYPHLYLLDKRIPDIDGLEICRQLKARPASRHIPVIVISASPKVGPQALGAGADAFLEKPFQMKTLLELIAKYA